MADIKYFDKASSLKFDRFGGKDSAAATTTDGLVATGTTTSAGAEGRAVLAAKEAPHGETHDFTLSADTLDLSPLTAGAHTHAVLTDAALAAGSHGFTSTWQLPTPWALVDHVTVTAAIEHHQDGAADIFTDHLAHHSSYDFG